MSSKVLEVGIPISEFKWPKLCENKKPKKMFAKSCWAGCLFVYLFVFPPPILSLFWFGPYHVTNLSGHRTGHTCWTLQHHSRVASRHNAGHWLFFNWSKVNILVSAVICVNILAEITVECEATFSWPLNELSHQYSSSNLDTRSEFLPSKSSQSRYFIKNQQPRNH